MCGLEFAIGVYVAVATVGDTVGAPVFMMELPVGPHFVTKLVGVAVEVLFQILGLVAVLNRYYDFFDVVFVRRRAGCGRDSNQALE